MDNPDPFEEQWKLVAQAMSDYLSNNSLYHHRGAYKGHSWPSGIWDTQKGEDKLSHKLHIHVPIPRISLLLQRIKIHGEETLGDSEGN